MMNFRQWARYMFQNNSAFRKTVKCLGFGLLFVFGLFLAYYGTYLSLLAGKVYSPNGRDPITGRNTFDIEPTFHLDGDLIALLMSPAHHCDRQLRSEYWSTVEHSSGLTWKNPGR